MAAAVVVTVIAANVGGGQPLHPHAEIAVVDRLHDEVEVIGHHAIRQHAHGEALTSVCNQTDESVVIGRLVKDLSATISAIDHVIADAAFR